MSRALPVVIALCCSPGLPSTVAADAVVTGATTTRSWPAGAPPWYRGEAPSGPVAVAPVQVAAAPPGTPEAGWPRAALQRLAAAVDDRLALRPQLRRVSGAMPAIGMPSLYLGCAIEDAGAGECDAAARHMIHAVTGPTRGWRRELPAILYGTGVDRLLILTVTVREHWIRQRDLKGTKDVPLGTRHAQPAPWLTSLDTPVQVLQIEALVVDREGKVLASGVEGVYASPTRFLESAAGLQRIITPGEIDEARTSLRRPDVAGSPLAWEAAVDELVRRLAGGA